MAFGGSQDIDIVVRVKEDGSSEVLDRTRQKIDAVEKSAKEATGSINALERSASNLGGVASAAAPAMGEIGAVIGALAGGAALAAGIALLGIATHIGTIATEGSKINSVASAFTNLSTEAGKASDVLLNQLRQATAGTITDFELMKRANDAMLANIKPDEFVKLTEAARVLSKTTGEDLAGAMARVTQAYQTGTTEVLRNKLGTIDTKAAQQELAAELGGTASQLTREGQLLANRTAILQAATKTVQDHSDITKDAGEQVKNFGVLWDNQIQRFDAAIAKNEALNQALTDLNTALSQLDFSIIIDGLSGIVTIGARAITTLHDIATAAPSSVAGSALRGALSAVPGGDLISNMRDQFASSLQTLDEVKKLSAELDSASSMLAQSQVAAGKGAERHRDGLIKLKDEGLKPTKEKIDQYQNALDSLDRQISKLVGAPLSDMAEGFKMTLEAVQNGDITWQQAKQAIGEYTDQLPHTAESIREVSQALGDASGALKAQGAAARQAESDAKELGLSIGGAIASGLQAAAKGDFPKAISSALTGTLSSIGKQAGEQLGESMGAELGTTLGSALGPIGGAIGSILGARISDDLTKALKGDVKQGLKDAFAMSTFGISEIIPDSVFDKIFGGNNAGTQFRKTVDKWFADAFEPGQLSVIINGQLSQIKDLNFGGTQFGDAASGFFDTLNAQAPAVQSAFQSVAASITGMLGLASDQAGNLAAVLANNVGGDLNNLQLLVQATGKSFEDLSVSIEMSMLKGDITIQQAAEDLQQLNNIMQKGIPGAIGAVDKAWANLQAAGEKGGRALLDSIVDVAAEGKELGAKTFPQLQDIMVNTFHISAQSASLYFQAMQAAGVTSFDQLMNASQETLIAIAANYENLIKGLNASFQSVTPPGADAAKIPAPSISSHSISSGSRNSVQDEAKKKAKDRADALKEQQSAIDDLVTSSKDYEETLKLLSTGEINSAKASAELLAYRTKATALLDAQKEAEKALAAEEAKGKKASADRITELLLAVSKAGKAIDDFKSGATTLGQDVVDNKFLLPANFQVNVQAEGLDLRDIKDLAENFNKLPLTKTFTLKLKVDASDKDKDLVRRVTSGFTVNQGPGTPGR